MRWFWGAFNAIVILFLLSPIIVLIIASFGDAAVLQFPPQGYSLRWYRAFADNAAFTTALDLSVKLGLWAALISLCIGTLAAYGIDRSRGGLRDLTLSFFLSPLMISTLVIGIALLQFFVQTGIPRSFGTLLAGHVILCLPYVVRTMTAALVNFNRTLEEAAMTLGANRAVTIWRITLPSLKAGLVAATTFAFITSFGNLAVSIFLTSARVSTLPIRVWGYLEFQRDPTIAAISAILVLVTVLIMLGVERLVGLDKFM